jgi:hypothetical protein
MKKGNSIYDNNSFGLTGHIESTAHTWEKHCTYYITNSLGQEVIYFSKYLCTIKLLILNKWMV